MALDRKRVVATAEGRATRGRPRDPAIDAAVLDMTRKVLEEQGFAGTTVQEVSRRTGVHPPAIYRRWPSRLALIEEAAFSTLKEVTFTPTGRLRDDVRRFVGEYEQNFGTPAARGAMPGLLAAYQRDEPASTAHRTHLSVRPKFFELLEAADGEIDPDVDPDEVFDLVLGAVLARTLVPTVSSRRRWLDATTDLIVKVLRPST